MEKKTTRTKKSTDKTTMIKRENEINNNLEDNTQSIINDNSDGITDCKNENTLNKEKKESIFHKIYNVIFWIVIACLAFIWITDYIRVKNNQEPNFCIRKSTVTFGDGTVDVCNGLGYNIYQYDRKSIKIKAQFSPFFVGMRK